MLTPRQQRQKELTDLRAELLQINSEMDALKSRRAELIEKHALYAFGDKVSFGTENVVNGVVTGYEYSGSTYVYAVLRKFEKLGTTETVPCLEGELSPGWQQS